MNPLSLLGYNWDQDGNMTGPSAQSWTLAGLSGASSFAGTLAQIGSIKASGRNARQSAYMSAQDELMNVTQANVAGAGQVAGLRKSLTNTLGSRMAIAGASGVDVGQGMVQDNASAITADNDVAAGVARRNAEIAARRHQVNALAQMLAGKQAEDQANSQAKATREAGILSAVLGGASMLLKAGL